MSRARTTAFSFTPPRRKKRRRRTRTKKTKEIRRLLRAFFYARTIIAVANARCCCCRCRCCCCCCCCNIYYCTLFFNTRHIYCSLYYTGNFLSIALSPHRARSCICCSRSTKCSPTFSASLSRSPRLDRARSRLPTRSSRTRRNLSTCP